MAQMTRPHIPPRRGQQRIAGGVCAGIAATLDVDVTLVRAAGRSGCRFS